MLFLLHGVGVLTLPGIKTLDTLSYDWRMRLIAPNTPDQRVAIIDIDPASLAAMGRWPWPRRRMAEMVNILFDHYHIRALGFDVVFAEPDTSSGLALLQSLAQRELKNNPPFLATLQRLTPQLDDDALFAQALENRRVVLGFYFSSNGTSSGQLPAPLNASVWGAINDKLLAGSSSGANLAVLQTAARYGGHFVPSSDGDGVSRRIPMVVNINGATYPTLVLALLNTARDQAVITPVIFDDGASGVLEGIRMGEHVFAVDQAARALIPYRGAAYTQQSISAASIFNRSVPLAALQNKIILVGTSAPGLNDLRTTPMGEGFPGVEVHANLLSGLLDGALLHRPDYLRAAEMLQLLAITALMWLLTRKRTPLQASIGALFLLMVIIAFNVYLWRQQALDMPLSSSALLLILLYLIHMIAAYFQETRHKQQLTKLFGQYVVPELVAKMSESPQNYSTAGQSRDISVLFTDVRGFTSLSERMDAASLARFMNEFLTGISTVIRDQREHYQPGTIDKYIGDCVMAFWGAPVADAEHSRHAVMAALAIEEMLLTLNPQLQARGWPAIQVGIGIHSGIANVGDMGSKYRMSYTAMGDTVNLASRIESLTKEYGVDILVSEATRQVATEFAYCEIDRVRVVGKQAAVTLYHVTRSPSADALIMTAMLANYRQQNWAAARLSIEQLSNATLAACYRQRIDELQKNPPAADWDGVFSLTKK